MPTFLDVEVADGAVHVPFPPGILLVCVAGVVDEPEATFGGLEVGWVEGAVAGFGDEAHCGEGEGWEFDGGDW